ncbi:MAG: class I SAM-dependent methyltransferase [Myxococcota bacterium]|nr:class I SAM-dependent methyltransferase [Myxococcota bacterium]
MTAAHSARMCDRWGPEISDLLVDYDPDTLARRPVIKAAVLARLRAEGRARPVRIAAAIAEGAGGELDPDAVDGVLVRSHLELQRLHEEFRVGAAMRLLLAPMLAVIRASTTERPIRVVDVGCGLGYILRWLAAAGALGDDVELIGTDYNAALVRGASKLAAAEGLRCSFVTGNAFQLRERAHVFVSTGVLHHFRGADLVRLFAEHETSGALGFVHVDIRPSWMAPIGSYVFHMARMREPVARWDGYWSAVRAHSGSVLLRAIAEGAPGFSPAMFDAAPGLYGAVRIFQAVLGIRTPLTRDLRAAYAPLARRIEASS